MCCGYGCGTRRCQNFVNGRNWSLRWNGDFWLTECVVPFYGW